jgi:hypothetical protein
VCVCVCVCVCVYMHMCDWVIMCAAELGTPSGEDFLRLADSRDGLGRATEEGPGR